MALLLREQVCRLGLGTPRVIFVIGGSCVSSVALSAWDQLQLVYESELPLDSTVVHALVIPQLDYCNTPCASVPWKMTQMLLQVQYEGARQLTGTALITHMIPVLCSWSEFKVLMMTVNAHPYINLPNH